MTRKLLRQFAHIGWHLEGWDWPTYLDLTIYQRWVLHDELADIIETTNEETGGAGTPRHLRRAGLR